MTAQREPKLRPKMQQAIEELKEIIRRKYPEATFRVERSPEDPRIIELMPTVDVEDTDEVMDVVVGRLGELQIEERLPLFVVPLRTPARNEAIWQAQKQRAASGRLPGPKP